MVEATIEDLVITTRSSSESDAVRRHGNNDDSAAGHVLYRFPSNYREDLVI